FFFSSRRRHTRFDCDWSSDVCSSDLVDLADPRKQPPALESVGLEKRDARLVLHEHETEDVGNADGRRHGYCVAQQVMGDPVPPRSEERRVGKEGRARWGAEREMKKVR